MQYLAENKDGHVIPITTIPIGIIDNSNNTQSPIIGIRRRKEKTVLYNTETEYTVGNENYSFDILKPDSIKGYTLIFPDIWKDIINKWHDDNKSQVISVRELNPDEIPKDRYFRNAWTQEKGKMNINMEKAKEVHKDKLRRARSQELDKLDIEYLKALENDDKKTMKEISNKKQILRDITNHPSIEAAKTPEELKQSVSHILNN